MLISQSEAVELEKVTESELDQLEKINRKNLVQFVEDLHSKAADSRTRVGQDNFWITCWLFNSQDIF